VSIAYNGFVKKHVVKYEQIFTVFHCADYLYFDYFFTDSKQFFQKNYRNNLLHLFNIYSFQLLFCLFLFFYMAFFCTEHPKLQAGRSSAFSKQAAF